MKLSKDELKQKVNELVTDNDIAIQLLEDIEDSMEVGKRSNRHKRNINKKGRKLKWL